MRHFGWSSVGLLISGLKVRALPGSPINNNDLRGISRSRRRAAWISQGSPDALGAPAPSNGGATWMQGLVLLLALPFLISCGSPTAPDALAPPASTASTGAFEASASAVDFSLLEPGPCALKIQRTPETNSVTVAFQIGSPADVTIDANLASVVAPYENMKLKAVLSIKNAFGGYPLAISWSVTLPSGHQATFVLLTLTAYGKNGQRVTSDRCGMY